MNLTYTSKVLGLVTFIFTLPILAGTQATRPNQPLDQLSLCQLTQDWRKYDHTAVRLRVIYHASGETSEIYDPACPSSNHTAWVALIPYGSPSPIPADLKKNLDNLLKQDGRARVTVVGEFDGPKQVDAPAGLPPDAADALRTTNSHYGHQNHWEFQFVFTKVEKVDAASKTDAWPRWENNK